MAKRKKRTEYEDLPLIPAVVADVVCERPYTAKEWSKGRVSATEIKKIEALRQKLTQAEIREFSTVCDARCKRAYENKAEWFEKIIAAQDNSGRDLLYMFVIHWMTGYLMNRETFMKRHAADMAALAKKPAKA